MASEKSERYTESEIAAIRSRYPKEGASLLAKEMGRTVPSVIDKAKRLGVKYDFVGAALLRANANRKSLRETRRLRIINQCEQLLLQEKHPLTTKELSRAVGVSAHSIGTILSQEIGGRIACIENGRNRKWALVDKKPNNNIIEQQKINEDNDAWFQQILLDVSRRKVFQQARARV